MAFQVEVTVEESLRLAARVSTLSRLWRADGRMGWKAMLGQSIRTSVVMSIKAEERWSIFVLVDSGAPTWNCDFGTSRRVSRLRLAED